MGQTGYEKTTFIQKVPENNLFGELEKIFWISKIPHSMEIEKKIDLFWKNCKIYVSTNSRRF